MKTLATRLFLLIVMAPLSPAAQAQDFAGPQALHDKLEAAIVTASQGQLKILGIKGVFLDVGINNLNAQSFYKKIGYKKLQVTQSQDGVFMIHQL